MLTRSASMLPNAVGAVAGASVGHEQNGRLSLGTPFHARLGESAMLDLLRFLFFWLDRCLFTANSPPNDLWSRRVVFYKGAKKTHEPSTSVQPADSPKPVQHQTS